MKLKKSSFIFLLMIFSFIIFPFSVKGQITQIIYPTKDAFAGTLYPDDNTGPDPWLWVSSAELAQYGRCQSYIEFFLPSDFSSYNVINLHFYITLSDSNSEFNIMIYGVIQEWEELTLNWTNRPSLWDYMLSRELEDNRIYDINLKDEIVAPIFSICILAEEYQWNLGQIPSKENDFVAVEKRLSIVLTNMDIIIISSIAGVTVASGVVVAVLFYRRKKKARTNIPLDSKEPET